MDRITEIMHEFKVKDIERLDLRLRDSDTNRNFLAKCYKVGTNIRIDVNEIRDVSKVG